MGLSLFSGPPFIVSLYVRKHTQGDIPGASVTYGVVRKTAIKPFISRKSPLLPDEPWKVGSGSQNKGGQLDQDFSPRSAINSL